MCKDWSQCRLPVDGNTSESFEQPVNMRINAIEEEIGTLPVSLSYRPIVVGDASAREVIDNNNG